MQRVSVTSRLLQTCMNTISHAHYTAVSYGKIDKTGCRADRPISCKCNVRLQNVF